MQYNSVVYVLFLFIIIFLLLLLFYVSFTSTHSERNTTLIFLCSLQPVCSQILEYQEPMLLNYERCAVTITQSPVFQRCSLLHRSHQQEPPPLRSESHHQLLAGNRSEMYQVSHNSEGGREQRFPRQQGRQRGSPFDNTTRGGAAW